MPPFLFFRALPASPALCALNYILVKERVQFLPGHVLLHLLEVEELRRLLHLERQLLLHVCTSSIDVSVMLGLHFMHHFLALLTEIANLFVPEGIVVPELVFVSPLKVRVFLRVTLLHLEDTSGL